MTDNDVARPPAVPFDPPPVGPDADASARRARPVAPLDPGVASAATLPTHELGEEAVPALTAALGDLAQPEPPEDDAPTPPADIAGPALVSPWAVPPPAPAPAPAPHDADPDPVELVVVEPEAGGALPSTAALDVPPAGVAPPPAPAVSAGSSADAGAALQAEAVSTAPESRPVRPLPRAIAIANQKGGVGKTTTAVNLGAALAELGYRVLVVDLDPQGNATTGLGINPRNLTASVYDVLMNETPVEDCVEPTAVRNLFVAPATIDLAGAEIELVPAFSRELRLRRALDRLGDEYDFVLVDCPPSLGLITINGLAAVNEVLVPIQCEYYALEGLGQLMRNVGLVQSNLNPRLELTTIVLTMYDARTKLADQVVREVRAHFGAKVCRNIVPRTVRLSEAPSFGQPILVFDPTSRGSIAYRELAKEVSGGTPRRSR